MRFLFDIRIIMQAILIVLALTEFNGCRNSKTPLSVSVNIDNNKVIRKMSFGLGQNWHVIDGPCYLPGSKSFDYAAGSAWGAVPPNNDVEKWNQILNHASWLGIDFIRLIIEQHMYCPEKAGVYTWESNEMKNLYRVLDWCESNEVDVFLTEQFAHTPWNCPPDAKSVVIHSPVDVDAWAQAYAAMVDLLVNKKHYTCIKCLNIGNEPERGFKGTDGWSWKYGASWSEGLDKAIHYVREVRGIHIPFAGPDDYCRVDTVKTDKRLGMYELHRYQVNTTQPAPAFANWIDSARKEGKPFFLGEFGGWIANPVQQSHSYRYNIGVVAWTIKELNLGVDGMLRWNFINRGDIDGDWQMIDTYDTLRNTLFSKIKPHPNTYYTQGLLSRFSAKKSDILETKSNNKAISVLGLKTQHGNYTIFAVNSDSSKICGMTLTIVNMVRDIKLYRYKVTPEDADKADVKICSSADFSIGSNTKSFTDNIEANSIYIYTTYNLGPNDKGIIEDNVIK